ncbi:28064_t:CDS:2, partial [Dentiscutata erythropus]
NNEAAMFYNYVKDLPFPDGPGNTEIQFSASKDDDDEYVTYELSNNEALNIGSQNNQEATQDINDSDEFDLYEPSNISSKKNKRSNEKTLNEAVEVPNNPKRNKISENKISNEPEYALYEKRSTPNKIFTGKTDYKYFWSISTLLAFRQVITSTITTGPFGINIFLEKEIDVENTSIMIKNGVASLSIPKKKPKQPVIILID